MLGIKIAGADTDPYLGKMQDKMIFRAMDSNFDERVTKGEFLDYAEKMFLRMDLDSSGALNANEMQEGYKAIMYRLRSGDPSL